MHLTVLVYATALLFIPVTSRALIQPPTPVNTSLTSSIGSGIFDGDPGQVQTAFDGYADDALWKKYVDRGNHLKCVMEARDAGAGALIDDKRKPPSAASQWSGDLTEQLKTWYWWEETVDFKRGKHCDFVTQQLKDAFAGVGLNAKPKTNDEGSPADGDNDCIGATHYNEKDWEDLEAEVPVPKEAKDQKYKVGDKEYTATKGFYWCGYNTKDGAIIAKNLESPATGAFYEWEPSRTPKSPDKMPNLRHASDIIWHYWQRKNPSLKNLRLYMAHNVQNADTQALFSRIFKLKKLDLKKWPGAMFGVDTDEGLALVGMSLPQDIIWNNLLTLSHKAELGVKHITKIEVFADDDENRAKWAHMFFHIEDVPPDEEDPGDKSGDKPGDKPGDVKADMAETINGKRVERSLDVRREKGNIVRMHTFHIRK
ncbi:hypothetical protein EK21DRAFT_109896 [Setomelanomma holmii]|uniref:Uncharacterized protein n=1 Tax=Setomelanomma holmii TaxID=210430 RepID=A0A9P4HCJ7_9PLEO|nr:hypothetical protein EK21DRAFT_109896 [Setomelanomma holmii]